jgi:hypothetical protein
LQLQVFSLLGNMLEKYLIMSQNKRQKKAAYVVAFFKYKFFKMGPLLWGQGGPMQG